MVSGLQEEAEVEPRLAFRRRSCPQGHGPRFRRVTAQECRRVRVVLEEQAGYLEYPKALAAGWPIATGVIARVRRHLIRDHFDITGSRCSLDRAEAMLKPPSRPCHR